jgi:hypothetical protein
MASHKKGKREAKSSGAKGQHKEPTANGHGAGGTRKRRKRLAEEVAPLTQGQPAAMSDAIAHPDGPFAEAGPGGGATRRAEDLLDRMTSFFGRAFSGLGVRAREGVAGIWAEAQHLRHGQPS